MPETKGIAYQLHDDGGGPEGRPPLILIHGAGGNRLHWPPRIRRQPGLKTYALDLPAHGGSRGRPESTISGYAERVMDWMRALELERAVIVGHSMGGAVALTMALRVPRAVAGAVLVATTAQFDVDPRILRLSAKRSTYPEAVQRVVGAAFSRAAAPELVEQAQERMLETEPAVFHADFRACAGYDIRQRLAEIECPAVVIYGQDDRLTPPKACRALAEGLPNGTAFGLAGAGHMVMLERPSDVAERLTRFLKEEVDSRP